MAMCMANIMDSHVIKILIFWITFIYNTIGIKNTIYQYKVDWLI